MSKKLLIPFVFSSLSFILSWGDEGHFIIARHALQNLPKEFVAAPLSYVFNYITESNSYLPVIFAADSYAFEQTDSRDDNEYLKLFRFKTKYLIINRMSADSKALASLYYNAWMMPGNQT